MSLVSSSDLYFKMLKVHAAFFDVITTINKVGITTLPKFNPYGEVGYELKMTFLFFLSFFLLLWLKLFQKNIKYIN